jgi:hypothetical protein
MIVPVTIVPQKTDSPAAPIKIVNRHWHDPLAPKSESVAVPLKRRSNQKS